MNPRERFREAFLPQGKNYYDVLLEILGIEPDFVAEMIDFWSEFVSEMLGIILKNVAVDHICISEDMAYRGGIDKRAIAKGGRIMEKEVMAFPRIFPGTIILNIPNFWQN